LSNAEACWTDLVCTCRNCAAFSDITDPKLEPDPMSMIDRFATPCIDIFLF
jgi:hypothetical protein